MTLAERGNNLNLDITFKDITEEGKENSGQKEKSDDVYGKAMKDMMPRPVFLWGKAVQNSLGMLLKSSCILFFLAGNLAFFLIFPKHLIAW